MMSFLDSVDTIILDAKADTRKGNYQTYEVYKHRLGLVCSDSEEYETACKELASALRV